MRRLLLLLPLLVAACSSGSSHAAPTTTTLKPLPPQLTTFLQGVKPAGTVAFTATYHVLRKLGGVETDVTVTATPPQWTVRAGDVVVGGPPDPSTADEAKLSPVGIFSNFFAEGPARALAADARRPTAGAPVFTDGVAAGVPLRCIAIPQGSAVGQTACLTPDGVFGLVDNGAVRYELTSYAVTATNR
jgi:hypothetical protein